MAINCLDLSQDHPFEATQSKSGASRAQKTPGNGEIICKVGPGKPTNKRSDLGSPTNGLKINMHIGCYNPYNWRKKTY